MAQIDEVTDHGIECLKKAAIVPKDSKPARYALRIRTDDVLSQFNSIQVTITTVTTSPTRILTPENSYSFFIEHQDSGEKLYMGDNVVASSTGYPLSDNIKLQFDNFYKNDNNEIYGICTSGTIKVYCVGVAKP